MGHPVTGRGNLNTGTWSFSLAVGRKSERMESYRIVYERLWLKLSDLPIIYIYIYIYIYIQDRLCGLVVRVPGYRSRGPGSIPGATRFSEK
jgi:hypothetical protein